MNNQQSSNVTSTGTYKRKARNYLLDPKFQLKYAGFLVLVALVLSTLLGLQVWRTSTEVIQQSQSAVIAGKETISRGKKMLEESRKVSKVVEMNIAHDPVYAEDPDLAAAFKADANKRAKKLLEEQNSLEQDAKHLEQQATYLRDHQRKTLYVLFIGITILVLAIGLAGIVFTHKIAGPVFKMQGLLRQVGAGNLHIRSGLRKGDELVEFFETFKKMVEALREKEQHDLDDVERAIAALKRDDTATAVKALNALRSEIKSRLTAA